MARKNSGTEQTKRNLWMLENVDKATRWQIKRYAFDHDMTIAAALKQLVEAGIAALEQQEK